LAQTKNSALLTLAYKNIFKKYKLVVNLQSRFIDEIFYEEMDDITGELSLKTFEPHNLWKITTTHTIFNGVCFKLGVDNIFNYTEIQNITSINPGRSFFFGVDIHFDKLIFKH
jgi:outer membrane receptor for ferrienterochelin and colicin